SSLVQGSSHGGRTFGFHPNDLRFWRKLLENGRKPGQQAASAQWGKDVIDRLSRLLQNFQGNGCLTFDHFLVVKRMDEYQVLSFPVEHRLLLRVVKSVPLQDHLRPLPTEHSG